MVQHKSYLEHQTTCCFFTLGAVKKGASRCSYKAYGEGAFVVVGMPSGISFRRPSSYGTTQLEAILKAKELIQFGNT